MDPLPLSVDGPEPFRRSDRDAREHENFKVVIRIRPALERELSVPSFQNIVTVTDENQQIALSEVLAEANADRASGTPQVVTNHVFKFDHIYDQESLQPTVYALTARGAVLSTLQGYNATIFAYGQTGTGKTHTMEGFSSGDGRGIIPRSMDEIFRHIEHCSSPQARFLVRASYLQIYQEGLSDLLKPERSSLSIREDRRRGVFVEGLSEWVCRTPNDVRTLIERGSSIRATAQTKLNDVSSRSHAVFIVIVEQSETYCGGEVASEEELAENGASNSAWLAESERAAGPPDMGQRQQRVRVGKLNLVDLAGSERPRLTGATGQRLEETKKINMSLSALGNVISALTDSRQRQHIPYRDSKLTRLLEDSLGGNCFTTMMAMISPAAEAFCESLSTLKFAHRAKAITNNPRVNEDADADQRTLLRRYETELRRLRAELKERSRNVVDKRQLVELEDDRRRAEQDRLAAVSMLQERSQILLLEKEEKRKLEERIREMSSQLLVGGRKIEDTPQFRHAVAEQERIRQEYAAKLSELEKERSTIEEDKAQVDRYKQLLLKQRDIMIALTQRLHERDEAIISLQDEFDNYDRRCAELEDLLDQKTAQVLELQRRIAIVEAGPGDAACAPGATAQPPVAPRDLKYTPENSVFDLHSERPMRFLTADEKVGELTALLDAQRQENHRLTLELEDSHADGHMLRERFAGLGRGPINHSLEPDILKLEQQCGALMQQNQTYAHLVERQLPALLDKVAESLIEVTAPPVTKLKLTQDVMALKKVLSSPLDSTTSLDSGRLSSPASHAAPRVEQPHVWDANGSFVAKSPSTTAPNDGSPMLPWGKAHAQVHSQANGHSRRENAPKVPPAAPPPTPRGAEQQPWAGSQGEPSDAVEGRPRSSRSDAPVRGVPISGRRRANSLGLSTGGRPSRGGSAPSTPHRAGRMVSGSSGSSTSVSEPRQRQLALGMAMDYAAAAAAAGSGAGGTTAVRRSASAGRVSALRVAERSSSGDGYGAGSTGRRTPGAWSVGSVGSSAAGAARLSIDKAEAQKSVDALLAKRKAEIRRICGSPRPGH